jgi:hypothetical protein
VRGWWKPSRLLWRRRDMWNKRPVRVPLLLVLPLALVASGCFDGSSSATPQTGRLVGTFFTSDCGVCVPPNTGPSPVQDAPILVTGTTTDGRHVRRGPTTDKDGRFVVRLPPGRYKVENGIYLNITGSATVEAGKTSHVKLVVTVQ